MQSVMGVCVCVWAVTLSLSLFSLILFSHSKISPTDFRGWQRSGGDGGGGVVHGGGGGGGHFWAGD